MKSLFTLIIIQPLENLYFNQYILLEFQEMDNFLYAADFRIMAL